MGRANSGLKQAIATWAKSIGTEKNRRAQYGNEGGVPWGYACANKIVFMTIKKTLGFDQCKAFFTAGILPLPV